MYGEKAIFESVKVSQKSKTRNFVYIGWPLELILKFKSFELDSFKISIELIT